jgi:hypothetical protein
MTRSARSLRPPEWLVAALPLKFPFRFLKSENVHPFPLCRVS